MDSKKIINSTTAALTALAGQIGGEIVDGELLYGPPDTRIHIWTEDGIMFELGSKSPLFSLKHGKPKRARLWTKGEDAGWYYVSVSAKQLRATLDHAVSYSDLEKNAIEFAYESVLRQYCVAHLEEFEKGLRIFEKGDKCGVEFPAGAGFIDILAEDSEGGLVVFELKLSHGRRAVVGQILEYIGWVHKNLAKPNQRVRGIIVARTISSELRNAVSRLPDVSVIGYDLKIKLNR